jgi:membrane protein implicated in regulation of membrane protease activity
MGEPLTSSMTLSGTLMLMICSLIYFDYIEIWVSLIWALVGLYLFVVGLLFNKIFLRRIGLAVILMDVVYSIVYVSRLENKALLGVGFMVLAIVLFICIWLFRWSEQKLKREKETDEETEMIEEKPIEG